MAGRYPKCEEMCQHGQELIKSGHKSKAEISARINKLMDKWKALKELAALRKVKIEDGIESHQVGRNFLSFF